MGAENSKISVSTESLFKADAKTLLMTLRGCTIGPLQSLDELHKNAFKIRVYVLATRGKPSGVEIWESDEVLAVGISSPEVSEPPTHCFKGILSGERFVFFSLDPCTYDYMRSSLCHARSFLTRKEFLGRLFSSLYTRDETLDQFINIDRTPIEPPTLCTMKITAATKPSDIIESSEDDEEEEEDVDDALVLVEPPKQPVAIQEEVNAIKQKEFERHQRRQEEEESFTEQLERITTTPNMVPVAEEEEEEVEEEREGTDTGTQIETIASITEPVEEDEEEEVGGNEEVEEEEEEEEKAALYTITESISSGTSEHSKTPVASPGNQSSTRKTKVFEFDSTSDESLSTKRTNAKSVSDEEEESISTDSLGSVETDKISKFFKVIGVDEDVPDEYSEESSLSDAAYASLRSQYNTQTPKQTPVHS